MLTVWRKGISECWRAVVKIVFSRRRVTDVETMESIVPEEGSKGILHCSIPYFRNSWVANASASMFSWAGSGRKHFLVLVSWWPSTWLSDGMTGNVVWHLWMAISMSHSECMHTDDGAPVYERQKRSLFSKPELSQWNSKGESGRAFALYLNA